MRNKTMAMVFIGLMIVSAIAVLSFDNEEEDESDADVLYRILYFTDNPTRQDHTVYTTTTVKLASYNTFTWAGHHMTGWQLVSADTTPHIYQAGDDFTPTSNVQFKALWAENQTSGEISVTFQKMGTTIYTTMTETIGSHYVFPADPVEPGYTFKGWTRVLDDLSTKVTESDIVTNTTYVLYAYWAEEYFTVNYQSNNTSWGTVSIAAEYNVRGGYEFSVSGNTLYINDGTPNYVIAHASTGCYFVGWSVTDGTVVSGDMTVTATFAQSVQYYTISFASNNTSYGTVSLSSIGSVLGGSVITVSGNTVTINGTTVTATPATDTPTIHYSFVSWNVQNGDTVSGNGTITAIFQTSYRSYTATFDAATNGGTLVGSATISVTYNSTYPTLPTATKANATFTGWYTQATGGIRIYEHQTVTITQNTTFYAQFISVQTVNTVFYNGDVVFDTITETVGSTFTFPSSTPTKTGWTFLSWTRSNGSTITEVSTVLQTDTALYASWYGELMSVTWDANEGTIDGSPAKTVSLRNGYVISNFFPTAVRTGYTIEGWYTDAVGGTKIQSADTLDVTASVTFYAHWTPMTKTVTFDPLNGSLPTAQRTKTVTYGQPYGQLPTPTPPTNKSFGGWYTSRTPASGDQPVTAQTVFQSTADLTLYAIYTNPAYTIVLDATTNGGTVTPDTITVYLSEPMSSLPLAGKTDNIFTGWYSTPSGDGIKYTASSIWIIPDNAILYARFTPGAYTVTFNPVGGELIGNATKDVYHGRTYGELPTASKIGATFNGWYTDAVGGTQITASSTVQIMENTTFYAHWDFVQYTVYFNLNGGSSISGTGSKTVSYGQPYGELPTATRSGYEFQGWFTSATEGELILATDIYEVTGNQTLYAHWSRINSLTVWWDNGYANGSVDVMYSFDSTVSKTHNMTLFLYAYDGVQGDADGIDYFTVSQYKLSVDVDYYKTSVIVTLYKNGSAIANTAKSMGNWPHFIISIDAQNSQVIFTGITGKVTDDVSFMDHTASTSKVVFDYSDKVSGLAICKIYHEDSETGSHPHFQVVGTTTFLDTWGFVMTDPSINIYDQFPEYDNIRLNFYSFAMYGKTVTINGKTWNMDGSTITDLYYTEYDSDGKTHYAVASAGTHGAIHKKVALNNIYVTWLNIGDSHPETDKQCYVTFVNENFVLEMGSYTGHNLTVSFSGVWYFTSAVWQPYDAVRTVYDMDWNSPFNVNSDQFILIFIAALVAVTVLLNVVTKPTFIDYVIIIGGGVIAYVLLGGF